MGFLKAVVRLPLKDKALLAEALTLLAVTRSAVVWLPFRWVVRILGRQEAVPPGAAEPDRPDRVFRIAHIIHHVSNSVPWTSKCLDQALTAQLMLSRRGIPATTYFGVKNDDHDELEAHAWLRCGSIFVTGGSNHARFTVITIFSTEGLR